ncbi:hypothetical protein CBR_g36963 [Chara braunii]|uniref:Uncharacterized protein n=1 Tax=Chara braunii TaxID=69332 RepID=A0A388JZK0_CHABU|nr:hypothetical protein CBR_g36963 [Chara braunii]|eukprot:GBG63195.1 hypothetical protein CBR_g36963 [Chara braunii]
MTLSTLSSSLPCIHNPFSIGFQGDSSEYSVQRRQILNLRLLPGKGTLSALQRVAQKGLKGSKPALLVSMVMGLIIRLMASSGLRFPSESVEAT